ATGRLHGELQAARDRLAVEVDRARAAVTGPTSFFRPRQAHPLAQRFEQGVPGLDEHLGRLVVHGAIQNLLGQVEVSYALARASAVVKVRRGGGRGGGGGEAGRPRRAGVGGRGGGRTRARGARGRWWHALAPAR